MLFWLEDSTNVFEAGPRPPNLEEPDEVEVTTEKPLPVDAAEKLFDVEKPLGVADEEKPLAVEAEDDL